MLDTSILISSLQSFCNLQRLGGTNYIVKLDGQTIVNTYEYRKLSCIPRENKILCTYVTGPHPATTGLWAVYLYRGFDSGVS